MKRLCNPILLEGCVDSSPNSKAGSDLHETAGLQPKLGSSWRRNHRGSKAHPRTINGNTLGCCYNDDNTKAGREKSTARKACWSEEAPDR